MYSEVIHKKLFLSFLEMQNCAVVFDIYENVKIHFPTMYTIEAARSCNFTHTKKIKTNSAQKRTLIKRYIYKNLANSKVIVLKQY